MNGEQLKDIRENTLKLSIRKMAATMGVSSSTIDRWERGKLPISRTVELAVGMLARVVESGAAEAGCGLVTGSDSPICRCAACANAAHPV